MPRLLPLLSALALACGPAAYVQPTEREPHAILKIRHIVHAQNGPLYGAQTMLGAFAIDERTIEPSQDGAQTIHLRIRPEPATFRVSAASFHYVQRQVQRQRQVPESYSCMQQHCSYGQHGTSCQPISSMCQRYRTELYWVTETVRVNDDACERAIPLAPRVDHVYLVQFDYLGGGDCQSQCFEQLVPATARATSSLARDLSAPAPSDPPASAAAPAEFTLVPCPLPPIRPG